MLLLFLFFGLAFLDLLLGPVRELVCRGRELVCRGRQRWLLWLWMLRLLHVRHAGLRIRALRVRVPLPLPLLHAKVGVGLGLGAGCRLLARGRCARRQFRWGHLRFGRAGVGSLSTRLLQTSGDGNGRRSPVAPSVVIIVDFMLLPRRGLRRPRALRAALGRAALHEALQPLRPRAVQDRGHAPPLEVLGVEAEAALVPPLELVRRDLQRDTSSLVLDGASSLVLGSTRSLLLRPRAQGPVSARRCRTNIASGKGLVRSWAEGFRDRLLAQPEVKPRQVREAPRRIARAS
mmetsp:Transcript_41930/g.121301  ORF Transcript_41930/g.121301 Transcript_41930/m.121301 type:complete len:290 (+) Transcript_41930:455-1324(+)